MTTIYILAAFAAGAFCSRALSALHRRLDRWEATQSAAARARYWADMQRQISDAPALPTGWGLREVRK